MSEYLTGDPPLGRDFAIPHHHPCHNRWFKAALDLSFVSGSIAFSVQGFGVVRALL